jgi:hypothetical protein
MDIEQSVNFFVLLNVSIPIRAVADLDVQGSALQAIEP